MKELLTELSELLKKYDARFIVSTEHQGADLSICVNNHKLSSIYLTAEPKFTQSVYSANIDKIINSINI